MARLLDLLTAAFAVWVSATGCSAPPAEPPPQPPTPPQLPVLAQSVDTDRQSRWASDVQIAELRAAQEACARWPGVHWSREVSKSRIHLESPSATYQELDALRKVSAGQPEEPSIVERMIALWDYIDEDAKNECVTARFARPMLAGDLARKRERLLTLAKIHELANTVPLELCEVLHARFPRYRVLLASCPGINAPAPPRAPAAPSASAPHASWF